MNTAQDQQSRELLPCPFCGSPNVTLEHIQSTAYEAFCEFCGASGPCDSEQWRAAKGWNARALPARGVDSMLDTPAGMEPGWFLHTLDITDGIPGNTLHERVTTEKAPPFGEPGRDYSAEYPATSTPLYTAAQVLAMGRVPPGWQAVPVEPTIAMLIAGDMPRISTEQTTKNHAAYAAMLAAAPRPPDAQERKPLTDEQVQDLIGFGDPTEQECYLVCLGWNAAHGLK